MRTLAIALILAGAAGCLRKTEYRCTDDGQCSGGMCADGFCAFADSSCSGGFRFDDSAGTASNQCVGDVPNPNPDAPVQPDPDSPSAGCPAGYNAVNGSAHKYKVLTASEDWPTQHAACKASSPAAYLAIPDDAAELALINTIETGTFWIGLNDMQTEGTFVNDKGVTQTFFMWFPGEPDNTGPNGPPGGGDCVVIETGLFRDQKCATKHPALCECEP